MNKNSSAIVSECKKIFDLLGIPEEFIAGNEFREFASILESLLLVPVVINRMVFQKKQSA